LECSEAGTPAESAICDDPDLLRLERRLSEAYVGLVERIGEDRARRVAERHSARHEACGDDADCLEEQLRASLQVFERRGRQEEEPEGTDDSETVVEQDAPADDGLSGAFMALPQEQRVAVQRRLEQAGLYDGAGEGRWDGATRRAFDAFLQGAGEGFDPSTETGAALMFDFIGSDAFAAAHGFEPDSADEGPGPALDPGRTSAEPATRPAATASRPLAEPPPPAVEPAPDPLPAEAGSATEPAPADPVAATEW
jgi:uncharacterized protein